MMWRFKTEITLLSPVHHCSKMTPCTKYRICIGIAEIRGRVSGMNLTLAILGGCFSSLGSVFSKISSLFNQQDEVQSYLPITFITAFFVGLMIVCNVSGLFLYTKSLHQTDSTIVSTVTSTASNYIVTGFFGITLFGETLTLMWLVGTAFVILGLVLIISSDESADEKTD